MRQTPAGVDEDRFYREAISARSVWVLCDPLGMPTATASDGAKATPFWSSRTRAEAIVRECPGYEGFTASFVDLQEWCRDWLPGLTASGLAVGLNWSGPTANGLDVTATDVLRGLRKRNVTFGRWPWMRRRSTQLATGAILVAAAVSPWLSSVFDSRTRTAVVRDYFHNINTANSHALAADIDPGGTSAAQAIVAGNRRPLLMQSIVFGEGTRPGEATATIRGTADGHAFTIELLLTRRDLRWYVVA